MTTISRPASRQVRRPVLPELVRGSAAALATLTRSLRAELSRIAATGQLGPDAEVEVGRWTGGRV